MDGDSTGKGEERREHGRGEICHNVESKYLI